MRIVFFGGGAFGIPALKLLAERHDVALAVCPPSRPAGRKMRLAPCPVAVAAQALSLPILEAGECPVSAVREKRPDALAVCDYGLRLSDDVLGIAPALNIHPSLLPRWRGAAPVARAIWAGDKRTGVTIMQIDSGIDTGAILLQEEIGIPPDADCGDMNEVLSEAGARLLLQALAEKPSLRPQAPEKATYARKICAAERALDFSKPAQEIALQVRALSPTPSAHAFWHGMRIKILRARAIDAEFSSAPGTPMLDGYAIRIACGEGALIPLRLQKEGSKEMDTEEFVRGLRVPPPGTLFQSAPPKR